MKDRRHTTCQSIQSSSLIQNLFLLSLLLYPFAAASHTLYLVPQALLLVVAVYRLTPGLAVIDYDRLKFDLVFLALATVAPAIAGELSAALPEYSEVGKLTLNIGTVILMLFSPKLFEFSLIAKWLPRFALLWLIVAIVAYIRAGTTFLDLAVIFSTGSSVSSSSLYGFAEPLSEVFLTKNIVAMYMVAIYGLFLYGAGVAGQKIKLWQHLVFPLVVLVFASRQGLLSIAAMVGIMRITSGLSYRRRLTETTLAASAGLIAFLTLFDLSSPDDGANGRLGLWAHFIQHVGSFALTGNGLHGLNASLLPLDIDNYHMFFMNQIGAYGILHCLAFNVFLWIIIFRASPSRFVPLLIAPYWLNVCFQTYGYEYGNLFLLMVAANMFQRHNKADSLKGKYRIANSALHPVLGEN